MKTWIITIASAVVVGVAFRLTGALDFSFWWEEYLAILGAYLLLNLLFISRYPKGYALRQLLGNIKPGQKVTVEGK